MIKSTFMHHTQIAKVHIVHAVRFTENTVTNLFHLFAQIEIIQITVKIELSFVHFAIGFNSHNSPAFTNKILFDYVWLKK